MSLSTSCLKILLVIFFSESDLPFPFHFYLQNHVSIFATEHQQHKKYVLWNTGICPIASKVGHVTLATPPLGSFIVSYVVRAIAYIQQRKNEESSFIRLKVMESTVPKFKK